MAESASIQSGRLPHACLVSAASREDALREAKRLAAAAVCSGRGPKPCGACRDCRKALSGVHPDIILVGRLTDDKGKQKAQITVDQIRALSADAVVLPNEAERKVYILDEAETMNAAAQNAALKLLEEPPAGAVFLLCTVNPMLLLPTRRRWSLPPGISKRSPAGTRLSSSAGAPPTRGWTAGAFRPSAAKCGSS